MAGDLIIHVNGKCIYRLDAAGLKAKNKQEVQKRIERVEEKSDPSIRFIAPSDKRDRCSI